MRTAILLVTLLLGCATDDVSPMGESASGGASIIAESGGATSSGSPSTGGLTQTSTGGAATGGQTVAAGGLLSVGGAATGGVTTGGPAQATGGATQTGGAPTGGTRSTDGIQTGGASPAEGGATGGAIATGGKPSTGGSPSATGGAGEICVPHTDTATPPTCLFTPDPSNPSKCVGSVNRVDYPDAAFRKWTQCPAYGAKVCSGQATQGDRDCWWACLSCIHYGDSAAANAACLAAIDGTNCTYS